MVDGGARLHLDVLAEEGAVVAGGVLMNARRAFGAMKVPRKGASMVNWFGLCRR
jgi:hypothetical protein